jgi:hypothetical protein
MACKIWSKNGKSKESSSPSVDKGRCSNNEDDGQTKVRRYEDSQGVEAHFGCDQRYGCKAWRLAIDARLKFESDGPKFGLSQLLHFSRAK